MKLARMLLLTTAALLAAALLTPASAQAAPSPGVWVSQTRGLSDGAVVRVVGHGLTPGASVAVTQCDVFSDDPEYTCRPTATVVAGPLGGVSLRVTLADLVFSDQPFGDDTPVYCRGDACRIYLSWTDEAGTPQVLASRKLFFRGAPATIAIDPDTGLVDGQVLRVSGTAVGAAGRRVRVVEQACFGIVQGSGCYGALSARTTRVQPGGAWSLTYTVRRVLPDDGNDWDCTDPGILGSCVLSATVLDADGAPDDSFGVSDLGQPRAFLDFAATAER